MGGSPTSARDTPDALPVGVPAGLAGSLPGPRRRRRGGVRPAIRRRAGGRGVRARALRRSRPRSPSPSGNAGRALDLDFTARASPAYRTGGRTPASSHSHRPDVGPRGVVLSPSAPVPGSPASVGTVAASPEPVAPRVAARGLETRPSPLAE